MPFGPRLFARGLRDARSVRGEQRLARVVARQRGHAVLVIPPRLRAAAIRELERIEIIEQVYRLRAAAFTRPR